MGFNRFVVGAFVALGLLYGYYRQVGTLPFFPEDKWNAFVGMSNQEETDMQSFDPENQFEKYQAIFDLLDVAYYDRGRLDIESMKESALKGFVHALGDPYTIYLTPDENTSFDEGMQGSQNFEGIGAVVTKRDDGIMVETVLKGSPAFEAGVMPLDLIVQIDDTLAEGLSLSEGVALIRGEKGSTVRLTILRSYEGTATIEEITVERDTIDVPSVEGEIIEEGGRRLLHLTVSIFGDDTISVFQRVLGEFDPQSVDGVIVDLRGNGGGYLPVAVDFASYFLPRNEIITTAKYTIFDDEVFRSRGYEGFQGKDTVVLVDGLSASASEIIAASLRERGGATIIGVQTFGKGSIQSLQDIPDGSSLKFTIGNRYTPSGKNIDEDGVSPTITVPLDIELYTEQGIDNQLQTALDYLTGNYENGDE